MNRTDFVKEIISTLKKLNGNEDIKTIREELEIVFELIEMDNDKSKKLPTAICGNNEDKEIKEQVEKACKTITNLEEAISTRTSPIRDPENPNKRYKIPNTLQGNNLIKSYKINIHQLNKYLALVYLFTEELINLDTFNVLVRNLRINKIGGFNKRRRETRKNKSKRKKSKNKSKRKKPKNKSTRKTKH